MRNNNVVHNQPTFLWPLVIAIILFVSLFLLSLSGVRLPAYAVFIDGKEQFTVKNINEVHEAVAKISIESANEGHYLDFNNDITFKPIFSNKSNILSNTELLLALQNNLNFATPAVAIKVNGNVIAYVESEIMAQEILKEIKNQYTISSEDVKLVSISFHEDIEIVEERVSTRNILEKDQVIDLITMGTDSPEKYTVKEGDSIWLIARKNSMYVDDIMRANKLKNENLSIGQELILVKSKPHINVVAMVEGEKIQEIPYETKVVTDNGSTRSVRVRQAGQNGQKQVSYVATLVNGVVKEEEIKSEKIIKEAVARVIVKGTQVTQVASRSGGSGALDWPVYGPITSYYGSRGGSHTGLDIGGRNGTDIRAADGGIVTFAGWQGGYGLLVVVDHGNGLVTRYAHCSSALVTRGQGVSRGQVIARVGSTGNSSGPHLHFEVLQNGSFRNPLNYLR